MEIVETRIIKTMPVKAPKKVKGACALNSDMINLSILPACCMACVFCAVLLVTGALRAGLNVYLPA